MNGQLDSFTKIEFSSFSYLDAGTFKKDFGETPIADSILFDIDSLNAEGQVWVYIFLSKQTSTKLVGFSLGNLIIKEEEKFGIYDPEKFPSVSKGIMTCFYKRIKNFDFNELEIRNEGLWIASFTVGFRSY